MRIVAFSDVHLDWITAGVPRFAEVNRAIAAVVDHAIKWKADLVLFLGDLCNADSGPVVFKCVESLMRVACRLKASRISFVAVAGNHDCDGSGITTLAPLHALADGDVQWTTVVGRLMPGSIVVAEQPSLFDLSDGDRFDPDRARLCLLPYKSGGYDPREVVRTFIDEQDIATIVAGHMTEIPGATYGEEQGEMARGKGVSFPLREVAELRRGCKSPTVLLNGHVHRRQRCSIPEAPGFEVLVPGSLARLTFGAEEKIEPGWIDVVI